MLISELRDMVGSALEIYNPALFLMVKMRIPETEEEIIFDVVGVDSFDQMKENNKYHRVLILKDMWWHDQIYRGMKILNLQDLFNMLRDEAYIEDGEVRLFTRRRKDYDIKKDLYDLTESLDNVDLRVSTVTTDYDEYHAMVLSNFNPDKEENKHDAV